MTPSNKANTSTQMGEFCTPRAVQERIKKLKKQAHAEFDPTSPANSGNLRGSSSKTTLTPVKATRKRKSTAARGKALQHKVVEPATDDEDPEDVKSEDDLENPSKVCYVLYLPSTILHHYQTQHRSSNSRFPTRRKRTPTQWKD